MLSKFLCLPKIRSSPRVEVIPPNEPLRPVGLRTNKGAIPADLQFVQVFAAAVVRGAKNPEASKHLIEFLASEKATPTVEKWGMKRPGLPRSVDRPLPDGRGRAWHIKDSRRAVRVSWWYFSLMYVYRPSARSSLRSICNEH
jgi:ABC-type thiamine transport system substrate-binding protein